MNTKTRPLSEVGDGSKETNSWGLNPWQRILCRQLLKILIGYSSCRVVIAQIVIALPLIQMETKRKILQREKKETGGWEPCQA